MKIDKKNLGPVCGNPPSLEWLSVEQLLVDPVYQRSIDSSQSRRIVIGMVQSWDWALCQPLVVTRRADGTLFVLDGQHRLEGARQRGDILHLPCVVLPARSDAEEAKAFVALNTKRQRLHQSEIFAGLLAQGDPAAIKTAELIAETVWAIVSRKAPSRFAPLELSVAPMLAKQVKAKGEAPVRNALVALGEAFPDKPVRSGSTMLHALIDLFAAKRVSDPDALIEVMGAVTEPNDWMLEAEDVRRANPVYSKREALAEALFRAMEEWMPNA